jgi:hypothetical protein
MIITKTGEDFSLVLEKPSATSTGTLRTKIQNTQNGKSHEFYVQTPRLPFKRDEPNKINLFFDTTTAKRSNCFYTFVRQIEDTICEQLSEFSKEYFTEYIDAKSIKENLLRSVVSLPDSLDAQIYMSLNMAPYCEIYDSKGALMKQPPVSSATSPFPPPGMLGKCILHVKDIIISSIQAVVTWEVAQIQLVPQPITDLPPNFEILEDPEEIGGKLCKLKIPSFH